jgi:hypothetical protein
MADRRRIRRAARVLMVLLLPPDNMRRAVIWRIRGDGVVHNRCGRAGCTAAAPVVAQGTVGGDAGRTPAPGHEVVAWADAQACR